MTTEEAQAFAERLTRIWEPLTPFSMQLWEDDERGDDEQQWHLAARLVPEFGLEVFTNEWGEVPVLRLEHQSRGRTNLIMSINFQGKDTRVEVHIFNDHVFGDLQIAAQWLPAFRRGCWLSGSDIEATAHEKAEWMREFTKEEVDSWKLKM